MGEYQYIDYVAAGADPRRIFAHGGSVGIVGRAVIREVEESWRRIPTEDGPDAARELREAEHALIDAVPEDSPVFAVRTQPTSPKWHPEWVKARAAYVRTFSDDDREAMLRYVTHDNPPLASDLAPPPPAARRPAQPSRLARASVWVLTLAMVQAALGCVLLAGEGQAALSAMAGGFAVALMWLTSYMRKRLLK